MEQCYDMEPKEKISEVLRGMCILLAVVGVVLWLSAPFVAINLRTIENKPTAYDVFADKEIRYIGDIKETDAYACAVCALVGLSGAFIGSCFKKRLVATLFSFGGFYGVLQRLEGVSSRAYEDLFDFGFWGVLGILAVISVLLVVQIGLSPPQKRVGKDDSDSEGPNTKKTDTIIF